MLGRPYTIGDIVAVANYDSSMRESEVVFPNRARPQRHPAPRPLETVRLTPSKQKGPNHLMPDYQIIIQPDAIEHALPRHSRDREALIVTAKDIPAAIEHTQRENPGSRVVSIEQIVPQTPFGKAIATEILEYVEPDFYQDAHGEDKNLFEMETDSQIYLIEQVAEALATQEIYRGLTIDTLHDGDGVLEPYVRVCFLDWITIVWRSVNIDIRDIITSRSGADGVTAIAKNLVSISNHNRLI